jgi:hypothetical protein
MSPQLFCLVPLEEFRLKLLGKRTQNVTTSEAAGPVEALREENSECHSCNASGIWTLIPS